MPPIRFSSTGSLLLKDLDKELSPASVDAGAVLTAKTTVRQGRGGGLGAAPTHALLAERVERGQEGGAKGDAPERRE